MTPLSALTRMSLGVLFLAGCADKDEQPVGVAPERISTEVEKAYQEREALRFGIDQLEQEAAAQQRAHAGFPGADPGAEFSPQMNANERK